MAEPIALAKAGDHKPRGIGRLSLGLQVVCALLLGILSGLFFGELMLKIAFIGEIYIGLLQMMVLPYIIISLLSGIGKLSLGQAMQLAKYAILVLFLMWFVIGAVLMVLPLALPELTSASFFSTSLVNQAEPVKFIDIFVPKNIFASLSNNQVPAVVIFCLALGIALITASSKDAVFKLLDVLGDAVIRVIKFVVTLSPVGVFAMTATAAGTMSFEELGRLQGYFILYTLAVLLLAGVILPGLIACLTRFPIVTSSRPSCPPWPCRSPLPRPWWPYPW